MRLFVTGAAGFIGSHLCERLVGRGDEVVGLDNFDPFTPRAMKEANVAALKAHPRFSLIEADLHDEAALVAALSSRPDVVVHLAALAGVRASLDSPERFHHVNVSGTLKLLEAARRHGSPRLVLASSSSVYGLSATPPFREDDAGDRPASPYAATKRAMEIEAFAYHHGFGLDVTCLRYFTVYGPRQRPDLAIHKFTKLLAEGKPLPFFGDGSSSRDYTWIDDIVDGSVAAIDRAAARTAPAFRVYNLGGAERTSLGELVELIASAVGRPATLDRHPVGLGEMPHTAADLTRAKADLGYAPKVRIRDGIPRFVAWWKSAYGSP